MTKEFPQRNSKEDDPDGIMNNGNKSKFSRGKNHAVRHHIHQVVTAKKIRGTRLVQNECEETASRIDVEGEKKRNHKPRILITGRYQWIRNSAGP
jgi:hypothetical protein